MVTTVCDACGGDTISHPLEYLSALLEPFGNTLSRPFSALLPSDRNLVAIYTLFEKAGLGRFVDEPTDDILLLSQVLWEEAKRRGIRMREFRPFGIPKNTFVATLQSGAQISFEGMPLPRGAAQTLPSWMDDKLRMKRELRRHGFPAPRGSAVMRKEDALRTFENLGGTVVVKPAIGSASRHTTMGITDPRELSSAFFLARRLGPRVIVEEELQGSVYRPTLVGGRLIATIRRDQPHVIGDGTHTIEELVAIENTHPKRQGPYFSLLRKDETALQELARQELSPRSVLTKGRVARLHQKINWALGGTTTDVTDEVHPDNTALFEEVAAMLGAPVVGIDFIAQDISRSWKEQERSGIIECNSMPFFDNHHLPFSGRPRDIAGPVWDIIERSYT